MITISRTITNSTLGLKTASCSKHPGRRRVHSGKPIKCFKKFDRKTTTTQEVKFIYGKQFENDQIRTRAITHSHTPRSHVSKRWYRQTHEILTQQQSRKRLTDAPATTHYGPASSAVGRGRCGFHHHHHICDHALSSPRGARHTEIETIFQFIAETDSDTTDT